MAEYDDLRLGCIPPDDLGPTISFAKLANDSNIDHSQVEPLVPAPSLDYLAPFESWNVLGNTRYNDCVAVTWANMRRLMSSKLSGREVYPSMDQVMEVYKTQNSELEPRQGMVTTKLFKHLIDNGGPDNVRLIAFADVQIKNFDQVRRALAIFGALWVEFTVGKQNKEEFEYQIPWKIPPKDDSEGGHAVLVGGYTEDRQLKIVTWGRTAYLSWDFVRTKIYAAWAVVWPEHFGSRRFTRGIDIDRLCAEYKELTNKDLIVPRQRLNSILVTHEGRPVEYFQVLKVEPNNDIDEDKRYMTNFTRTVTPITARNALNAVLTIDNDDLYLIRTKDTPSNYVETQRVLSPQYYEFDSGTPTVTAFKCRFSDTGVFCVDNGDLYFIKIPQNNSQPIEVHWAPHEKRFKSVERYITGFSLPPNLDRAVISGGDLYLLVRGSEYLEVHCARGNANYSSSSISTHVTGLKLDTISKVLTIGLNGDLYMIKHSQTIGSKVEVWIATAGSGYVTIRKYPTQLDADDVFNAARTDTDVVVDGDKIPARAPRRWIV